MLQAQSLPFKQETQSPQVALALIARYHLVARAQHAQAVYAAEQEHH
jgi:hypothetical protein